MRFFALFAIVIFLAACHRKITTEKTTTTSTDKPAEAAPTVVVSGDGKVVTPTVKTKSGEKVYPVTSARSFTPNQKKNLMYRFKTIPPMVLNVPDSLAQKNANGSFYVLRKKFWYWKKADGFYYLDETYYN